MIQPCFLNNFQFIEIYSEGFVTNTENSTLIDHQDNLTTSDLVNKITNLRQYHHQENELFEKEKKYFKINEMRYSKDWDYFYAQGSGNIEELEFNMEALTSYNNETELVKNETDEFVSLCFVTNPEVEVYQTNADKFLNWTVLILCLLNIVFIWSWLKKKRENYVTLYLTSAFTNISIHLMRFGIAFFSDDRRIFDNFYQVNGIWSYLVVVTIHILALFSIYPCYQAINWRDFHVSQQKNKMAEEQNARTIYI